MNDPLVQLEESKPVIKDLFRYLLIEMKNFKYQITLKVLLKVVSVLLKIVSKALTKQGKMLFISLQKLFSFSR